MPVPRCPVCGHEAVDLSQQETHSAQQSMDKSDAEVVICHCKESHRFVVSLTSAVKALPHLAVNPQRERARHLAERQLARTGDSVNNTPAQG